MNDSLEVTSVPSPERGVDRRSVLALVGAAGLSAGVLAPAGSASAAVTLGETAGDVYTIDQALAEAQQSAWGGHQNGRIPASALTAVLSSVQGSGYLRSDAARDYFSMSLAFSSAIGRPLDITEGYRDYARQQEYWDRYQAGTGNLAAFPGTSNHGWGISCDFGSGVQTAGTPAKRWLDANGPSFGWSPTGNGFSRPEPWHFDYVRPWDGAVAEQRGLGVVVMRCSQTLPAVGAGYIAVAGVRYLRHLTSLDMVNASRVVGVPYYEVSSSTFLNALDALSVPRSAVTGGADYWRR